MERIENPMVLCDPFEEEEKALEECKSCEKIHCHSSLKYRIQSLQKLKIQVKN